MLRNEQSPEPQDLESDLEFQSVFQSIQGEGPFIGSPAVFFRLLGCNLQCPRCDTDYTSSREKGGLSFRLGGAISWMKKRGVSLAVITGGEPFRQDISPFVDQILILSSEAKIRVHVQIETNGFFEIPFRIKSLIERGVVSVVCSPKAGKIPDERWDYFSSVKYPVSRDSDFNEMGLPQRVLGLSALAPMPPMSYQGRIYLMPEEVQMGRKSLKKTEDEKTVLDAIVQHKCLEHGHSFGFRLHSHLGIV